MQSINSVREYYKELLAKYNYFIRFSIVGTINTIVDFLVFSIFLNFFNFDISISQGAGYITGMINSFIFNKYWTFNDKKTKKMHIFYQSIKFISINIISLIVSSLFIKYFSNELNLNDYISKIIVTLITQLINYFGYKLWVFEENVIRS